MNVTFFAYITRKYQGTFTRQADILADMELSSDFPRKARSKTKVLRYLDTKGPSPACRRAFEDALDEYEQWAGLQKTSKAGPK